MLSFQVKINAKNHRLSVRHVESAPLSQGLQGAAERYSSILKDYDLSHPWILPGFPNHIHDSFLLGGFCIGFVSACIGWMVVLSSPLYFDLLHHHSLITSTKSGSTETTAASVLGIWTTNRRARAPCTFRKTPSTPSNGPPRMRTRVPFSKWSSSGL